MPQQNLTYEDLVQLVELIKSAEQFSEFRLKVGEVELSMRRAPGGAGAVRAAPAVAPTVAPAAAPPPPPLPAPAEDAFPEGAIQIRAPMVGTFYRAPMPGAAPFVEVGTRVEEDTTLCIIEVMKLMNSIPAGCRGTVTHVLVADAAPVQYGQTLIVVRPD